MLDQLINRLLQGSHYMECSASDLPSCIAKDSECLVGDHRELYPCRIRTVLDMLVISSTVSERRTKNRLWPLDLSRG